MKHRDWRSLVAFTAAGLVLSACSGSSPLSPGQGANPASTAARPSPPGVVFPLLGGTLTVTTKDGTLNGTYTGQARDSTGVFSLVITGGTGAFAGGSGTLSGAGEGGFIGEGRYSHVLTGELSTAAGSRKIRIRIRGTATVSCVNELPILTLAGSGQATRFGPITSTAMHQIGNAGCNSD